MKQPKIQFDHMSLGVKNLEETLDFYHKLFGFEVVEESRIQDDKRFVVLQAGENMLCMGEHPERKMAQGYDPHHPHLKINHFALRVDDPVAWEALLKEYNIPLNYGGPVQYPYSTSWYVSDPSGHEIEVVHWQQGRANFGGLTQGK